MEYTTVECENSGDLEYEVTRLLAKGWRCQGGVSMTTYTTEDRNGYTDRRSAYIQALVREEKGAMKHPDQYLYKDEHGTVRFRANAIVRFLLDSGPFDMNALAMMDFSGEDRMQFAQLIGYSLSGFSELSYVSDEVYERASAQEVRDANAL